MSIKYIDKSFFRFCLVGIINTMIGTITMLISYHIFDLGYWISTALNYIVGTFFSFFANREFTFCALNQNIYLQAIKFLLNIAVCYILAFSMAKVLVEYAIGEVLSDIKITDQIAMALGMIVFVLLNYLGQKRVVFSRH